MKVSGPVLQDGFPGIPDNGEVTPPDPVIAAGPDHLVALVDNEIGIFDKNSGEQLLLIDPGEWFKNVYRVAVPYYDARRRERNKYKLVNAFDDRKLLTVSCERLHIF